MGKDNTKVSFSKTGVKYLAFSTNETSPSQNDILKIFLDRHTNIMKAKSLHAISCEFSFDSFHKKIMMISLPHINRIYQGISDVSFYFFFGDLESLNVEKNFELVCCYIKNNCDLNKNFLFLEFGELEMELIFKKLNMKILKKFWMKWGLNIFIMN